LAEEVSIECFEKLLEKEKIKMVSVCQKWEAKLRHLAQEIPELIQGMIRSAVGQGRQILAERFPQFRDLVDRCASGVGVPKVLVSDLQGFWEMIDIQVKDVQEKFSVVSVSESNGWCFPLTVAEEVVTVKTTSMATLVNKRGNKGNSRPRSAPSEGLKNLIVQRRRKMQTDKILEVRIDKDEQIESKAAELSPAALKTFDGGFFTLSSPAAPLLLGGGGRTHCQTARSVGRKAPVTRSVTASARRTASLLSPFVSRFGKLSAVTREELELPSRCRFLLDNLDDSLNTAPEESAGDASETGDVSEAVVDVTSAMLNCSLSAAAP